MSALFAESTLAIAFPSEDQGIVLPCVKVEIQPPPVSGEQKVEMRGYLGSEATGRIEVVLKIKTNNHHLLSTLSYDNTEVEIVVRKKEAQ